MVLPLSVLKTTSQCLFSFSKAAKKIRNFFFFSLHKNKNPLPTSKPSLDHHQLKESSKDYSILFNFNVSLLSSNSVFPFFMATAFEGGGPVRAALLLLAYPLVLLLGESSDVGLRVMTFVTFCGMTCEDMRVVERVVLPKIYMEVIDRRCYEAAVGARRRVVVSGMPVVMVRRFVEECFGGSEVVGAELEVVGGRWFTGRFSCCGTSVERAAEVESRFGKGGRGVFVFPYSKEVYIINSTTPTTTKNSTVAAGDTTTYPSTPKSPIFHDGRLAFLPTPAASLSLLLWLPFSLLLSLLRILTGLLLPYHLSLPLGSSLGVRLRLSHQTPANHHHHPTSNVLFICTHRTLLDPIFLSHALSRPVPAVTYSLSHLTESFSPIPTVRLSRNRRHDADTMRRLLAAGDLAVCPEGTTCREPYLLRFSPLFAELGVEIEPVAIHAEGFMFYATTATGRKWLDPVFFFMNPRPGYRVSFLGRVPREMTVDGGLTATEVANRIQGELAEELGFECTALTRRDKYRALAGNEGR